MPKQRKRTRKGDLLTLEGALLSADAAMNCLLAKIKPTDIAKLWSAIEDCVRAAKGHTTLARQENGTTLRVVSLADVTACITADGFVLRFTEKGT